MIADHGKECWYNYNSSTNFAFARSLWHSSDLWYTYGALEKCWRLFTDDDRNLSNIMIKYFSNFIRTGDPNGEELVKWPSYEEDKKAFMHFDIVECKAKKTKLSQILKNTFVKKTLESGF